MLRRFASALFSKSSSITIGRCNLIAGESLARVGVRSYNKLNKEKSVEAVDGKYEGISKIKEVIMWEEIQGCDIQN